MERSSSDTQMYHKASVSHLIPAVSEGKNPAISVMMGKHPKEIVSTMQQA